MAGERLKRLASSSNVPALAFALPALILFIGFKLRECSRSGSSHPDDSTCSTSTRLLAEYRRKLLSFGTLQFS